MPTLPYIDKEKKTIESPHVILLGAGSSKAAFPNGDAYGRKLPLMNELTDVLDLKDTIEKHGFLGDMANFEAFYSEIFDQPQYKNLVDEIQKEVREYFETLEIPNEVTIYDYLILSLREKDIIATFNWDPLLLKAYLRNLKAKPLPQLAFLHGNVYLGVCNTDQRLGYLGSLCENCHSPLQPVQLLYPTLQKDYSKDPVIKFQWDSLTNLLEHCYFFTIFGYSAPKTDFEARKLMKKAWSDNKTVELSQIEIIDTKDREELSKNWSEFTIQNHYSALTKFEDSWLWSFPRQTCEALFDATMQNDPRKPTPFPKTDSLEELHKFINELKIEALRYR
ncbi:MAG: hypothetical protein ACYDIA_00885 [Candidatus Humimicrobiaceae bacterium]